jgi:hypothetical protein
MVYKDAGLLADDSMILFVNGMQFYNVTLSLIQGLENFCC